MEATTTTTHPRPHELSVDEDTPRGDSVATSQPQPVLDGMAPVVIPIPMDVDPTATETLPSKITQTTTIMDVTAEQVGGGLDTCGVGGVGESDYVDVVVHHNVVVNHSNECAGLPSTATSNVTDAMDFTTAVSKEPLSPSWDTSQTSVSPSSSPSSIEATTTTSTIGNRKQKSTPSKKKTPTKRQKGVTATDIGTLSSHPSTRLEQLYSKIRSPTALETPPTQVHHCH